MIGPRGRQLIKEAEGLQLDVYLCPAGKWTIGYGHTRGVTRDFPPITEGYANAMLEEDLAAVEKALGRYVLAPLTPAMRDALASWVFNLGEGRLLISTMLKRLNARDYAAVPDELRKWVYSHDHDGKPVRLTGLVIRREAEALLFLADGLPDGVSSPA